MNRTMFLRLTDRTLLPKSPIINCTLRAKYTFILDSQDNLWHVNTSGSLELIERHHSQVKFPHLLQPPRGFNNKLSRYAPPEMTHITLLQLISQTEYTIRELYQYQQMTTQSGSLVSGIGAALGGALKSAGSAGSQLVGAIGGAIKTSLEGFGDADEKIIRSFVDSTAKVIDSSGTAMEKVFHGIFGGLPGIFIWIVLGPLALYIAYLHCTGRLAICKCRPHTQQSDRSRSPSPSRSAENISLQVIPSPLTSRRLRSQRSCTSMASMIPHPSSPSHRRQHQPDLHPVYEDIGAITAAVVHHDSEPHYFHPSS